MQKSVEQGEKIIAKMNAAIAHRGPDGSGIFCSEDGRIVLGSRRLSIVDVAEGSQPISTEVDGKRYTIVFNGEIFNHKELHANLRKKHSFRTKSDTEVLLLSYAEWGADCLQRIHGQFAFAIFDEPKNAIFFARDRVGIKPLYYSVLPNGTFLISSEPKGILSHPDCPRELDHEAIADYFLGSLTLVNGCEPLDRSFFRNIRSLPPGACGTLNTEGLALRTYEDLPMPKGNRQGIKVSALRAAIEKAVLEQTPKEVPYGAALSGGLDSSIVCTIAARRSMQQLIACAIRYEDAENPDYEHAKLLADRENIDLRAPVLSGKRLMQNLDAMLIAMDKPHDTVRQLGLFEMYRTLHDDGCKVALVGEGADEFHLGYYEKSPGFKRDIGTINSPETFRAVLKNRAMEAKRFFAGTFLEQVSFDAIIERDIRDCYEACPSEDPIDRMQYYYAKKFLKYRLDANDRCAMAHSIEARVPFCDEEVVRLSLQVPHNQNLANGTEKAVLRQACIDILPEEIAQRRKYALPESKDLRLYHLIVDALEQNIASADPSIWNILNRWFIVDIANIAREKIEALEEAGIGGNALAAEIPLTEKVEFRIKHAFLALTFLRWYQLYFVDALFTDSKEQDHREVPL